jgi:hypothetical protein
MQGIRWDTWSIAGPNGGKCTRIPIDGQDLGLHAQAHPLSDIPDRAIVLEM